MMYKIMYALIMSTSLNTLLMITPITLGLNILLMSMITSMLFAYSNSSWMAFMIFLIYISGTLVMFSYFLAMTPNSSLSSPIHLPLILMTPPLMFSMLSTMNTSTPLSIYTMSTNTFYNKSTMMSLMMMALILLITMIIVVKIASMNKGPLRPFNYA